MDNSKRTTRRYRTIIQQEYSIVKAFACNFLCYNRRMINKTNTPLGVLVWCLYAAYAMLFLGVFTPRLGSWVVPLELLCAVLGVGIPLFLLVRNLLQLKGIGQRSRTIAQLMNKQQLEMYPTTAPTLSTNFMVLKPREPYMFNTLAGPDWRYSDFRQTIYRKFRRDEYRAGYVYYSILQLDLQRALPTMLFDSPKAHRHQFKTYFDRGQIHRLEGDFDRHFTTYFPKYYTIDALSIITPEVMQAMITADGFDIEIDGSKLYLYGPLVPVNQLPLMIEKGKAVREKLMNNLLTYRDERLNAMVGRSGVSVYGTELRKNPFHGWLTGAAGLALLVVFFLTGHSVISLLEYGLLLLAPAVYYVCRQLYRNRQLDKQYEQHMQFLENQQRGLRKLG